MTPTNQLLPTFRQLPVRETPILSPQQDITTRINKAHRCCIDNPTTGLVFARDAGEALLQLQEQLTPSEWQTWLAQNCNFSEKTAQTYISIAQGWPTLTPPPSSALLTKKPEYFHPSLTFDIDEENWEEETEQPIQMTATLEATPSLFKQKTVEKITFFLPGNVVPKARPRVTRNGTYLPPRYRAWRNFAEVELYRQMNEKQNLPVFPIPRAAVKVRLIGKHRMNADADNIIGSFLDALVAVGVFKNDNISYIPEIAFKLIPEGIQGAHITIIPLPTDLTAD
ncbi:RusA family crossover junction endodeoxyribonuclease [Ancylothrix sp. C2]|uniref:RusA family crossover junction endodeoxyribonuclease n=1 Tax=Ancylothrix sp. D3o TaxID=2953691 RepID=UPI0021BB0936|nr:RusA family crossover junction endodeoxyribonuclease [Ancylothrix sp. D3o]MCT7952376.1 RusA family crossover junction endodeoxyribonuclease [Ancylothrix sp. D3o]